MNPLFTSTEEQSHFLCAAGHIADRLSAEQGGNLLALLAAVSADHEQALATYLLWCRGYNRRDFIEALRPIPAVELIQLQLQSKTEALTALKDDILRAAVDNGWNGKVQAAVAPEQLTTHFEKELAARLKTLCEIYRRQLLSRAQAAAYARGHRDVPEVVDYCDKRYKPALWHKVIRQFADHGVSPSQFLAWCAGRGGIPWPDSYAKLLPAYASTHRGQRPQRIAMPVDLKSFIRTLIDDDLKPEDIACLALQAGQLGVQGLDFLPARLWAALAWSLPGEPLAARAQPT